MTEATIAPAAGARLAVRELRTVYTDLPPDGELVSSPEAVARVLTRMFDLASDVRENFFVLSVDARNRLIGVELGARGGTNSCSLSPREILSTALVSGACGIVAAHNHPSGDPSPSGDDYAFTRRLAEACRLVGLELLDHVIVAVTGGEVRHTSLAARGVL